jgi:hypothetical protein
LVKPFPISLGSRPAVRPLINGVARYPPLRSGGYKGVKGGGPAPKVPGTRINLTAEAVKAHVEVVDAGALTPVGIESTDRADEAHAVVVAAVPHRALEHRVPGRRLDYYRIVRPGRPLRLLAILRLLRGIVAKHLGVDEGQRLELGALGIIAEHPV